MATSLTDPAGNTSVNPLGSYINNATAATFPISGTAEAGSQVSAVSKVIDS